MKQALITLVGAVALVGYAGLASAKISGNIAVTSDYVFRGISQADNRPALQGGLDYSNPSGFYAGVWSSTADWAPNVAQEWDLYTGWGGKLSEALSWDLNVLYYAYSGGPHVGDFDFFEFTPALSYDFGSFSLGGKLSYSNDYLGSLGNSYYGQVNLSVPLPDSFTLGAHAGYQRVDKAQPDHYVDYSLSLGKSYAGLDFTVAATTTDLSKSECTSFAGDSSWCDTRAVFTVGKSF